MAFLRPREIKQTKYGARQHSTLIEQARHLQVLEMKIDTQNGSPPATGKKLLIGS
jgi:hypothetical protein